MNLSDLRRLTDAQWDEDILPRLMDYVRVPAKSPAFDASWAAHGHLARVVQSAHQWARERRIQGLKVEIVSIDGLTPCIFFDAPATHGLGEDRTVLLHGPLAKQPDHTGWRAAPGSRIRQLRNGRPDGRGEGDNR